jgi:hypothetical protein
MPRALDTHAPDAHRDGGAKPAAAAPLPAAPDTTRILWLQRAAGNQAVAAQLARRPAPAPAPAASPTPAAPPAGAHAKVVAGPPQTHGVERGEEGPHPGADLESGTDTVTLTVLIRDLNLKGRDPATIDWLHEPGVAIEATRGRIPKPVLSAAISALNAHVRVHGKDIAEIALDAKASVDQHGSPSAHAELKAEVQLSATFSISAGTSLSAGPRKEGDEEGGIPLAPHGSSVSLDWSPMSIALKATLGAPSGEQRPGIVDYGPDMEEGKIGAHVAAQLSPAELGPFSPTKIVNELLDSLNAARGAEATWAMHLGVMSDKEIPPGITRALARAADLVVRAKPSLRRVESIRVTMLRSDEAEKREKAVRWFVIPVGSVTVASTPAAPAEPPPRRTWGAPD